MQSSQSKCNDIHSILFDSVSGACVKLNHLPLSDIENIKIQVTVIDNVFSVPSNISDDNVMIVTNETFVEWCSGFIVKLLKESDFIDETDRLLGYMSSMYDHLPLSSRVFKNSLFNNENLNTVLLAFLYNFHTSPKSLIKVYTKFWVFCQKEIARDSVFCAVMSSLYDLIRNSNNDAFLPDLFQYATFILNTHVANLRHKMQTPQSLNGCLKLAQVIVRTEGHAVARLHFWWHFICSVKREIFLHMMDSCLTPFLANLFGKYASLDRDRKFGYSLSEHNCISSRRLLGPLCKHVMGCLLQALVAGTSVEGLPRPDGGLPCLDRDLFSGTLTLREGLEPLMAVCGHWCLFGEEDAFHRLEVVFTVFAGRFPCTSETADQTLSSVVENCLTIKEVLEAELPARSQEEVFCAPLPLLSSMAQSLISRPATVRLLRECLSVMGRLVTRRGDLSTVVHQDSHILWDETCASLARALPGLCQSLLGPPVVPWMSPLIGRPGRVALVNSDVWAANLRVWTALTEPICTEIASGTIAVSGDLLSALVDHLRVPMILLALLEPDSLYKEEYESLRSLHGRLLDAVISKGHNANVQISSSLMDQLAQMDPPCQASQLNLALTSLLVLARLSPCPEVLRALQAALSVLDGPSVRPTLKRVPSSLADLFPKRDDQDDSSSEDSNMKLALEVVETLLKGLGKDSLALREALSDMTPSLVRISALGLGKVGMGTRRSGLAQAHRDAPKIEEFYLSILKYVQKEFRNDQSLVVALVPIFTFLFSANVDVSRVTMTAIVELWNDLISWNHGDNYKIDFLKDLDDSLRYTKQFYSSLKVTHIYREIEDENKVAIKDQVDIKGKPEFGSFLSRLNKGNTPIKNVQSPNVMKRGRGRHSIKGGFELSKQNSDADYTVILSPQTKRQRLTEHQKEVFCEQKNNFIPTMYNDLDDIPKMALVSQDSLRSVDFADVDSKNVNERTKISLNLNKENVSEEVMETNEDICVVESNEDVIDEMIASAIAETGMDTGEDIDKSSVESKENDANVSVVKVADTTKAFEKRLKNVDNGESKEENKNNKDKCVDKEEENVDKINVSEAMEINNASQNDSNATKIDISESKAEGNVESKEENKDNKDKSVNIEEENDDKIKETEAVDINNASQNDSNAVLKTRPIFEKRFLPGATRSPSVSSRSYKMVQMALKNLEQKTTEEPVEKLRPVETLPAISLRSVDRNTTSIMKQTWSESKKDARVSFSVPLVQEEQDVVSAFLSPVTDRSQKRQSVALPQFDEVDVLSDDDDGMLKVEREVPVMVPGSPEVVREAPVTVQSPQQSFSVTCSDQRSAEKVRRSMDEMRDVSPIRAVGKDEFQEAVNLVRDHLRQGSAQMFRDTVLFLLSARPDDL